MVRIRTVVIACALLFTAIFISSTSAARDSLATRWQEKVDPWVTATASAEGDAEFLLFLDEQAELDGAERLADKGDKGSYVYAQLTATARRSQPAVTAALDGLGVAYRTYWIANMIWVRGDLTVVQEMARRPEVAHVYANPHVAMSLPAPRQTDAQETPAGIEGNIVQVKAPALWAMGIVGDGVVIGGQDTGYDWDHVALRDQYRGWDGSSADHNYSWHDAVHSSSGVCGADSPQPCDDLGHGTHTMGTMIGDDGLSHQIGVAPGARWIGCRNMNAGVGTPATYAECFQWFVAPTDLGGNNPDPNMAPHVVNNSWTCPAGEGCTDPDVLRTVIENTRAAGIVVVVSASNDGPKCSSVAAPPAIYEAGFAVGAVGADDVIASFSSRGPVTVDGSNRLKPDVVAPGIGVLSSIPGNNYGTLSGTSMAGPHVAGLAALLISSRPSLAGQVNLIEAIMRGGALPLTITEETCGGIPGTALPNNTYGYGRIDSLASYRLAEPQGYFAIVGR